VKTTALTALAEPNRLRIVELLGVAPYSVGEIAEKLVLRQPQVSKHLKILSETGWVSARPRSQKTIYELRPERFTELDGWLESFRQLWESRYDALDQLFEKQKGEES
jgi:DNA-binding transcriptional ArsR family regulator